MAAPALALTAAGKIEALAKLEPGRWQLKDSGGATVRSVCLGDPTALLTVEHEDAVCGSELISTDETGGTVQYTCPGHGFGHSSVRVETARLARIDTQGVLDGRPFAYRAEARKIGPC
ncbi:MAG TPA: hypothetical protein VHM92_11065 [Allosphingosinicella sp.]|nr:hypothetical protein [Allosphingosinicella sp.]